MPAWPPLLGCHQRLLVAPNSCRLTASTLGLSLQLPTDRLHPRFELADRPSVRCIRYRPVVYPRLGHDAAGAARFAALAPRVYCRPTVPASSGSKCRRAALPLPCRAALPLPCCCCCRCSAVALPLRCSAALPCRSLPCRCPVAAASDRRRFERVTVRGENYERVPDDLVKLGFVPPDAIEELRASGLTYGITEMLKLAGKGGMTQIGSNTAYYQIW